MEEDLRDALARGELSCLPAGRNGRSNQFTGFEALMRWNHPERGPITPACSSRSPRKGIDRPAGRMGAAPGLRRTPRLAGRDPGGGQRFAGQFNGEACRPW